MISIKITPVKTLEKTFKNPEEKFIHDFDNRFGGRAIVDDESNTIPFSILNNTCSRSEINAWIDQWISENCDLSNHFKLNANVFLENQFKRAQNHDQAKDQKHT